MNVFILIVIDELVCKIFTFKTDFIFVKFEWKKGNFLMKNQLFMVLSNSNILKKFFVRLRSYEIVSGLLMVDHLIYTCIS